MAEKAKAKWAVADGACLRRSEAGGVPAGGARHRARGSEEGPFGGGGTGTGGAPVDWVSGTLVQLATGPRRLARLAAGRTETLDQAGHPSGHVPNGRGRLGLPGRRPEAGGVRRKFGQLVIDLARVDGKPDNAGGLGPASK